MAQSGGLVAQRRLATTGLVMQRMQMQAAASKLKRTNYLPTQRLLDANVHVWKHQHANATYGKRMNVACQQQNPRPPFHSPAYSYYANHYA